MRTALFAYGWGLAGVLAWGGCELEQPAVALPRCRDGQGLATDAQGNFHCTALLPTRLTVPPPTAGCAAGQTLDFTADPTQLTCVDKLQGATGQTDGKALRQHIDDVGQKLASLSASVAQLRALAVPPEPVYVGSTSVATTGRITTAGQTGLLAAATLCTAQFGAGAHMCTQFQLTRSVALGKLGPQVTIAPAWIYMPTWHNPNNSLIEPFSGLADNCGGYTTDSDTAGWTGMAVEWSPLAAGEVVFRWHGGNEALCSASLPIACCAGGHP